MSLELFETSIELRANIKTHGRMSLTASEGMTIVCRTDLDDQGTVCLGNTGDGNTCESNTGLETLYPDPAEFEHKEPAVFNGHDCFVYYDDNETGFLWASEDGTVWGFSVPGYAEVNFTYPSTPYTADMFVLPSDVSCESFPKILTPPEEGVLADACIMPTSSSTMDPSSTANPSSPEGSSNPVNPEKSSSSDMNTACGTSVPVVLMLLAAVASLLIF